MYEATITEDVQILRNLIYMPGYHHSGQNIIKHRIMYLQYRKSLKTTYNEIDEVGYEFIKMLSKMFGEEFLNTNKLQQIMIIMAIKNWDVAKTIKILIMLCTSYF